MGIQAAEISAILKDQIKNFGQETEVAEIGRGRVSPNPLQVGHAPWGALKEKRRGSCSGSEIWQVGQALN